MRKRVAAAVITLLLFCAIFPFVSYNLHMVLSGQSELVSIHPATVLGGLFIPQVRRFFLLGAALALVGVGYMLFGHIGLKYRSDMRRITPNIETPAAEGQGQYGTARWLEPEALGRVFKTVRMDESAALIRALTTCGREDLGDLHNQKPKEDNRDEA